MLTLHHAPNTRAGCIVWLLEELQLPYELNRMEFHPGALKSDEHRARHSDGALEPAVDSPLSPRDLQWFHYGEGMVMPPINTIVVHTRLLPPERRNEEILGQGKRLLTRTLKPLNEALAGRDDLLGELSGVEFMLGHACTMARRLGCKPEETTHLQADVKRLEARPAFHKGLQS